MRRVKFLLAYRKQEFYLGAYVDWRDVHAAGVELGLKLGLWTVAVRFIPQRTLADRMLEALNR